MRTTSLIKYGIVNLILLLVTIAISFYIVMQRNHYWLTEELILGMLYVPAITLGVGCALSLLTWGLRIATRIVYVLPAMALSYFCGWFIVFNGPALVHDYQNFQMAQQQAASNVGNDRLHLDAPGLRDTAFDHLMQGMTVDMELRDVQVLPDNKDYYWVRFSKKEFFGGTNWIGMFNGKTNNLSPLKTTDELWTDAQKFQNQKLGDYSDVRWDLKDSEIVFVGKGWSHTNYHVHLATDGSVVQIDRVNTGS